MIQTMYCNSGKHELALLKDQCPFCENERLRRQLAAAEVVVRAMWSIEYGTNPTSAIHFTTQEVHRTAVDALASIKRVEQTP